jgi:AhpD family alkylhydroperoxidase
LKKIERIIKMTTNYVELHDHLDAGISTLMKELPGAMAGFTLLHRKAVEDGVLSGKTKELIALSVSVAMRCEGCIAYHVYDAIKAGANRAEMMDAIGVAVMMGGAPAAVYATYALDAIQQFFPAKIDQAT